jgi:hypothetical protein
VARGIRQGWQCNTVNVGQACASAVFRLHQQLPKHASAQTREAEGGPTILDVARSFEGGLGDARLVGIWLVARRLSPGRVQHVGLGLGDLSFSYSVVQR